VSSGVRGKKDRAPGASSRSRITAQEKRYGVADTFCEDGSKNDWNLVQANKGESVNHSCKVFDSCVIEVGKDYGAKCIHGHEEKHRFFPVRQNLNKAIYV